MEKENKKMVGKKFSRKFDFHFPLMLRKFKRKMAVMLPKDVGAIIAYADIGKDSVVVEIGAGNGFLTYYLARIAKVVYAYEIRDDAYEILKENIKMANLDNVIIKKEDGKFFTEKNVDAVITDIADAYDIVEHAYNALKDNGAFVCYLPNIEQVKETYERAKDIFKETFVLSIIAMDYKIEEKATRPMNKGILHTAYLMFARK